jgi:copper transport protein
MTRLTKPLVFLATAVVMLLATAAPAFAHADLEGSTPAAGAQVATSPKEIALRFTEAVTVDDDSVRVLDSKREPVKTGDVIPDGAVVRVAVEERLADGVYAVQYRVVSDDSHPVSGLFTFGVGNVTLDSSTSAFANDLGNDNSGNDVVNVTYAIVRGLVFASLAIVIGASAFVTAFWPEGWASRRVRRLVAGGWVVALLTTLAGIGLQGAYATGGGLSDAVDPSVISDVLDTRFGKAWVARAILLLLLAPVLVGLARAKSRRGVLPIVGAALAIMIMFTPGIAGHASTGRWVALAMPADAIHLLAMSIWFGGLVVLAIEVLRSDDIDALEPVMERFSRMAMFAVGAIIVTGAFQSVRQVEALHDFVDTSYGRLLLVKLGAFAAVLVVASASRDIVRFEIRRSARSQLPTPLPAGPGAMRATPDVPDPEDTVRRLRTAVWYEVAFALAILAVTALLVNAAPARGAEAAEPFSATLKSDDNSVWFDVAVTPARVGPNQVHITPVKPTGEIAPLVDISATLSQPGENTAPLDVELLSVGGTHYQSRAASIPFAGRWRIEITGLVSDVDQVTVAGEFDVSG